MSQQGPGGYGGGGPYGPPGNGPPPGGGYPPGGGSPPGGYPPGGYGPPGYGPPGGAPPAYGPPGGPPPAYGPGQPGYGAGYQSPAGAPPKKSKALLWAGLGCGLLLLLGAAGSVAGYFYLRGQVSDAESALARAASAATSGIPLPAPGTLTPACAKAVACCKTTMAKTAGANAAAAEQVCNGIGFLSENVCEKQYEDQKRAATLVGGTCP